MEMTESIPGLPGLFVAGVFSAALRYIRTYTFERVEKAREKKRKENREREEEEKREIVVSVYF